MSKSFLEVDERRFEDEVLKRSGDVPVIVDFWAPWCGPCRVLGPVLEELAATAKDSWVLVKINSDENPTVARAYGIRGIPAVKAFVNGTVVDEFTGALPKSEVEAFLRRVVPTEADRLARQAVEAARRGDREREKELWDRLLEAEPGHALALVRRARLVLAAGDVDAARRDLLEVPADSELHPDAQSLLLLAGWASRVAQRGGSETVRTRAAEHPDDASARYDFGCALAVAGDFEGALAEMLEVVRADRGFEDDAGRRGMLALFSFLGDGHELTREYRGRLGAILF